jgi:hypothetical protein
MLILLVLNAEIKMQHITSESSIDRVYREEFLGKLSSVDCKKNGSVWSFACPYCSPLEMKDPKKKKKTACLIWNISQNSWKFACQRCGKKTNFFHALRDFDPGLASRYQLERDQAGTTGWGHDCPSGHPEQDHRPRFVAVPPGPLNGQEKEQEHQSPSAPIRLPRLTPQQQAGCQAALNRKMKQRSREHDCLP